MLTHCYLLHLQHCSCFRDVVIYHCIEVSSYDCCHQVSDCNCHPSVWALTEALQADAAEASATVLKHAVGNLVPPTRSRAARKLQERLRRLCEEYAAGVRELAQFLRAVGHCVRFVCE